MSASVCSMRNASPINKTKSLLDAINIPKMPYANLLTHSLTYSHTPNLEMLSHLKIRGSFQTDVLFNVAKFHLNMTSFNNMMNKIIV